MELKAVATKELAQRTGASVGRLVHEALRSPGGPPFPPEERMPVTEALLARLVRLAHVDMNGLTAVRPGYREVARQLRRKARNDPSLSAEAASFVDLVTDWLCLQFTVLPCQPAARTPHDWSQLLAELIIKLDELAPGGGLPDLRDARFHRHYLTYVAKRHGQLTIYGVDLVNSPSKWPLEVAYLSLEVSAPKTDWLLTTNELTVGVDDHRPLSPLPADQVLAHHDRVLLRGVAGSGKTTLVQWLAVSATRADPDGAMSHLYGRVPLVMPLRTLTRHGEPLPAPDGFLGASGCPIAETQPEGWTDRVLTQGRGLVLIDGIDEIPEAERDRARTWLSELIAAYPDNRWLVTSRPSAVQDDWLAADGFTELTLSAMSPAAVATFIAHWHKAAATGNADEDNQLTAYEQQLLTAIRSKTDLGRLATNPLMCGLICALHRDRRGYLPQGRKELYEAALAMLLTRRDRERAVLTTGGAELQQEPQTQLLQRLAYWLIRNGRTEMDRDRAEQIVADMLPAVPSAAALGDAKAVFRHLLDRTGLLREPAPDAVDFIHRTFQDYLGARAAVEIWDIGLLVEHAVDDQWEDVIRMAVAHARPRERAEILQGLLAKGDACEKGRERSRVFLLAAACLEHATELDPKVRGAVEERAATLIPPTTPQEAEALAAVGPLVLDLLPGPEGLTEATALRVVTTAVRVASDTAIPYLARFARHRSPSVRYLLTTCWSKFDAEQYARQVIAHVPPEGAILQVESPAQVRELRSMGGRPLVFFRGALPQHEIAAYVAEVQPTDVTIGGNPELTDLSSLAEATGLISLSVMDCPRLIGVDNLRGLKLQWLTLERLGRHLDLGPLATLDHLQMLSFALPGHGLWSMAMLPTHAPLRWLNLGLRTPAPEDGLFGLSRFAELRTLMLSPAASPSSTAEWSELHRLGELFTLRLSAASLQLCPPATTFTTVSRLTLDTDPSEQPNLVRLPAQFPAVTHLALAATFDSRPDWDLTPLKDLPALQQLTLPPSGVHTLALDQLPSHIQIK
ncbi:NACHT domain-containing protein [Streptomyces sp. NBC_00663]|uniref:NACHT domain-containing protein n=1 Tax=Streptomyces sp. NBC_00663 TaxID=2975801 RepID=UPI002E33330D|nr:NACHT domain-containing protein [Streptomyces sp. NBC_00663]